MPQYRFVLFREGAAARGSAAAFRDDEAAIEFARRAAKDDQAELWSGDRLLWRQPPRDAKTD